MSLLRPGVIKQHKPNHSNPQSVMHNVMYQDQLIELFQWVDLLEKLLYYKPSQSSIFHLKVLFFNWYTLYFNCMLCISQSMKHITETYWPSDQSDVPHKEPLYCDIDKYHHNIVSKLPQCYYTKAIQLVTAVTN